MKEFADSSLKIRELLGEEFLNSIEAKEFRTKGNDLQFRISSKNKIKSNMVKIEETPQGYAVKFYTYQPFRHIFNVLMNLNSNESELKESVKGVLGK